MIPIIDRFIAKKHIERYLEEDLGWGDITTDLLVDLKVTAHAYIKAKESGVIAGLPVAEMVYNTLDPAIQFIPLVQDGFFIDTQTVIAEVKGPMNPILKGERLCLNLLQRMSGIATYTRRLSDMIKPYKAELTDTRKTAPGLRYFDRYAVAVGGGINHRYNLADAVLIKDNHIKLAGGVKAALSKVQSNLSHTMKIEIEVEGLQQLQQAIECHADIILLDNMPLDMMRRAVEITAGRAILEASGNIDESNIADVAATGIDIISSGALTHSVNALDISMRIE
ncbi:carboxylating nicotinate-nucleotide diphosphorylase [Mahella australiensis]|uniref:Probable nicotinate-nucleotide pyrophosphorylase [carboxylating] n=1 Tax=Mahella australiensis (strain DSM 15567 / CIP 107919 / 50-1 BON) TaxID=697281 RepID=F3ZVH6_MAHA5|nr:nicotinate-nucleotide pyrophosphorylase (carboxylating) [Mahella australiensis 50-1 BON]